MFQHVLHSHTREVFDYAAQFGLDCCGHFLQRWAQTAQNGRFFSEFLDETHADHNRASLVMGCFPWVNFRRKFFTFLIDTGRPAFIFLLGLSLFVEVINNKPGEGFKGLAYLLWNCLNGQETWFGAWQVTVVIVGVIFMWDLLFSLSKLYVDRRLLS